MVSAEIAWVAPIPHLMFFLEGNLVTMQTQIKDTVTKMMTFKNYSMDRLLKNPQTPSCVVLALGKRHRR